FRSFADYVCEEVSKFTNEEFTSAQNKFHALTSYDEVVYAHGSLKALAANLLKVTNDIRFLASRPRSGIGEITIPANEPGSSIMPGKVKPTQGEALSMVCVQVIVNNTTIGVAASQGHLELNVYKPLKANNFLLACKQLATGIDPSNELCATGIEANTAQIEGYLHN